MEEGLAASGGQDGKSCEHAYSHPGDVDKLLNKPKWLVDRQWYRAGDIGDRARRRSTAECSPDCLDGVAEQQSVQSLLHAAHGLSGPVGPARVAHDPPRVGGRERGVADPLGHVVGRSVAGQTGNITPAYAAHDGALEFPCSITLGSWAATDLDDAHPGRADCMASLPEVCMALLPGVIICVVVLGQREIDDHGHRRRGRRNLSGTRIGHRYHPRSTIRGRSRFRKRRRGWIMCDLRLDAPVSPRPASQVASEGRAPRVASLQGHGRRAR
jgi:hypothetical protein